MRDERGFSLIELLVAMLIMLIISGAATSALLKMTSTQATIWNRTQMHSGIRGATEVLQQEVGQAGRVALPAAVTLTGAVTSPVPPPSALSSVSGMFPANSSTIDAGSNQETVQVTAVHASPAHDHGEFSVAAPERLRLSRRSAAFQAGVVPPSTTNGSTGTVLKLFGDINADGNMVYIEYTCDYDAGTGNLYRNSMAWNTATKAAGDGVADPPRPTSSANPGGTACFTYQTSTMAGNGFRHERGRYPDGADAAASIRSPRRTRRKPRRS